MRAKSAPEFGSAANERAPGYYGRWIVAVAFLNLFFAVGIVYYGFPVFYPSLIDSLHFSRQQVTNGLFFGFAVMAPVFGLLAGALIDRRGARAVTRAGSLFVGVSLILLGSVMRLWQYYLFCFTEVVGYVLTGPIPNQVLVSNWFRQYRGRAMGYAYLGLGLGGVAAPKLVQWLIEAFGWRHAFQIIGVLMLVVLVPVAQWVTRSWPPAAGPASASGAPQAGTAAPAVLSLGRAARTRNFWLILLGSTAILFSIGTVIFHFVLSLRDQRYTVGQATWFMTGLLSASLAGRVLVGYIADRFRRKNVMALFYLLLAGSIPLLLLARHPGVVWLFAAVFGFAMGADYMLIPLVTADCFGLAALGKLLAAIIMADSLGQTLGPVLAGKIYDLHHSYAQAWVICSVVGVAGAGLIFAIREKRA